MNCVSLLQGFWDRKMGSSTLRAELSFRHAFYFVRDVRVADIPVAWLAYVRTYCVPIATLNHSKRSRLLDLFSLFIHQVLSCNYFSVGLFLFIVYLVGRLKLKTKSEAPMQNFWSLFDIMLKCRRWKIAEICEDRDVERRYPPKIEPAACNAATSGEK